MAFVNKRDDELGMITVDEERGIILNNVGGVGQERVTFFELGWKEELIKIEAMEAEDTQEKAERMHWTVITVGIPEHLQTEKREIISTIEEALKAYGFFYGKGKINETNVEFATSLE